jgi:hypothetical protein
MARDRASIVEALSSLRRSWWFCEIEGLRPVPGYTTYAEFDLDDQPDVGGVDGSLSWLEGQPEHRRWSIHDSDQAPQRRLTAEELAALVRVDLRLPPTLTVLAKRADLQRRIRSATGCYLDLGDELVPTSKEGGYLLHLLSDQQWVRHWLVYLDRDGGESVVTTAEPVGFVLPEDDEWEARPPDVIPLDGSFDLQVCADSVGEFLFRFWVENELHFGRGFRKASPAVSSYAAQLQARRT